MSKCKVKGVKFEDIVSDSLLHFGPKVFNPINMVFLIRKQLRMVDPKMLKIRYIQDIITPPTVRINNSIRNDFVLDDGN